MDGGKLMGEHESIGERIALRCTAPGPGRVGLAAAINEAVANAKASLRAEWLEMESERDRERQRAELAERERDEARERSMLLAEMLRRVVHVGLTESDRGELLAVLAAAKGILDEQS